MTQTKLSPTDTRLAFIKEVTAPLEERALQILSFREAGVEIEDFTVEQLTEIAIKMSQATHLGRTPKWKQACQFAVIEIGQAEKAATLDQSRARWAVLQGSIQMGWAA
jgi:hypothetical protein